MTQYSKMTFEEFVAYAKDYTIDGCHPQIVDEAITRLNNLQVENEELKTQVSFLLRACERADKRIETAEERMRKKIADKLTTILLKAIEVDDK